MDIQKIFREFKRKFLEREVEECWIWLSKFNGKNHDYGVFTVDDKKYYAHRISYCYYNNLTLDDIEGKEVIHCCNDTRCMNPNHLKLGTHEESMKNRTIKGNTALGQRNGQSKLTNEIVLEIRRRYREEKINQTKLAEQYNLSQKQVSCIITGKQWINLPL